MFIQILNNYLDMHEETWITYQTDNINVAVYSKIC
jgi:hypothetical protein